MPDPTPPLQPVPDLKEAGARVAALASFQAAVNDALAEARTDLNTALLDLYDKTNAPSVNLEIPGMGKVGKVTLPEVKDAVQVVDDAAYTEWVAAHYAAEGATEWVQRVRPNFREAHIKALTKSADYATGQVIDEALTKRSEAGEVVTVAGVKAVKGEGFKSPSITGLRKEDIVEYLRGSTLLALTASPEPQPADPNVVDGEVVEPIPSAEDVAKMNAPDVRMRAKGLGLIGNGKTAGVRDLRRQLTEHYAAKAAEQ